LYIFTKINELRAHIKSLKKENKTIGFVPTMGALHRGHIALIEKSVVEANFTVCSIYVNPLQFNNQSDLENYPKSIELDIELLKEAKCDALFIPNDAELYPSRENLLSIEMGYQNTILEGAMRPGHFSGVAVVLTKLFHIVNPDLVYFGQKDLQQCFVVKQLITQLNFEIDMRIVPTLREENGLAMSSRNRRLTPTQLSDAGQIYKNLKYAEKYILTKSWPDIESEVKKELRFYNIELEYIKCLDYNTGMLIDSDFKNRTIAICIAAYIGKVRLIDNIIIQT
jgi:pantoate--beta-alanine ligase